MKSIFEKLKPVIVSTLEIAENELVDITDPCYEKATWCRKNDVKVKAGTYVCNAYTDKTDKYGWGRGRVWGIELIYSDKLGTGKYNWELLDNDIGVDAGLAGFFVNKPDFSDSEWSNLCDLMDDMEITHPKLPRAYVCEDGDWKGFWSQSGCGDGCYEVFALRDGEDIVGLRLDFFGRDE